MPRRLARKKRGAVLGGVAAGFGEFFDLDPVVVRLAFILLALLDGVGIVFYVVCWVAMPGEAADGGGIGAPAVDRAVEQARAAGERVAESLRGTAARFSSAAPGSGASADAVASDTGEGAAFASAAAGVANARAGFGVVLIVVGLAFLLDELGIDFWPSWASIELLWPTLLIVLGGALVARSGWRPTA